MTTHATGTLEIASWDEEPYLQIDDKRKLTTTKVTQRFHGDIEGDGSAVWLTAYRTDGTAEYAGFQRIVGTIGGVEGTVVLRMTGSYDGTVARSAWEVVAGVGSGGFETITGAGESDAPADGTPSYTLDYDLR